MSLRRALELPVASASSGMNCSGRRCFLPRKGGRLEEEDADASITPEIAVRSPDVDADGSGLAAEGGGSPPGGAATKRFGEYCFLLREGTRRYESGGEACAIGTAARNSDEFAWKRIKNRKIQPFV